MYGLLDTVARVGTDAIRILAFRCRRGAKNARAAPLPRGQAKIGVLDQLDRRGFAAAPRLRHHHPHGLPGLELVEAGAAQCRHMDEDVLAAVIGQDEAEAARRVVPFDHAVEQLGGPATATAAMAALVAAAAAAGAAW